VRGAPARALENSARRREAPLHAASDVHRRAVPVVGLGELLQDERGEIEREDVLALMCRPDRDREARADEAGAARDEEVFWGRSRVHILQTADGGAVQSPRGRPLVSSPRSWFVRPPFPLSRVDAPSLVRCLQHRNPHA